MTIEVFGYGTKQCLFCFKAKKLLMENQLPFTYYAIDDDPSFSSELISRAPEVETVPQVFIDGQHIGGYEELKKWEQQRNLA